MADSKAPHEKELHVDDLAFPDQAIVASLGFTAIEALKKWKQVTFAVDVLGRVQILKPGSVVITKPPKVQRSDLDLLEESVALKVMISQNEKESDIFDYLRAREAKKG